MTTRTVVSQAELDAALASDFTGEIWIDSPKHVGIILSDTRGKWVGVTGNSTIERATGNSTIEWATGNSTIEWATGNSTIERATGNSTIKWATGTSLVHRLDGSASVAAGSYVTVYLYSASATVEGGRVIDMTALDRDDPATWCDLNGVTVVDGRATVYKGVNAELTSEHGTTYPIGETVTAPDWQPTRTCGAGLHFSPTPLATHAYCTPARYLECTVDLASMIVLDDKVKAESCVVVREVDRFARPVTVEAVTS